MKYSSCAHLVPLVCALLLGCLVSSTAHADLRDARVCSQADVQLLVPPQLRQNEVCYSGFECVVGMRGDWLDLTNQVLTSRVGRTTSGHPVEANASIHFRGTDPHFNECLPPANKDREGFVKVALTNISGSGRLRITANRPAPLGVGVHSDHYDVDVRDGSRYVRPHDRADARKGESKVIEFTGMGLTDVRLKTRAVVQASSNAGSATATTPRIAAMASALRAPVSPQKLSTLQDSVALRPLATTPGASTQANTAISPPVPAPVPEVTIIGKTQTMLRLEVNFKERGIYSLADYLEFADGEPPINADMGWPTVDVPF